jgi:multiple antibiotic resistance protein
MVDLLKTLPNTFIPLFVAIDIFWLLPIFFSLTGGMEPRRRRRVIRQSVATAFAVGIGFTAVGEFVFGVLGISVNDFKVAGGLLLIVLAMLDLSGSEYKEKLMSTDTVGVVPIGVPLIVGPAVLTTALVLVEHYGVLATMAALVLNLVVVYAAFSGARRVIGFLGSGGIGALSKIMAILLASIAVMMIRLGIEGMLGG